VPSDCCKHSASTVSLRSSPEQAVLPSPLNESNLQCPVAHAASQPTERSCCGVHGHIALAALLNSQLPWSSAGCNLGRQLSIAECSSRSTMFDMPQLRHLASASGSAYLTGRQLHGQLAFNFIVNCFFLTQLLSITAGVAGACTCKGAHSSAAVQGQSGGTRAFQAGPTMAAGAMLCRRAMQCQALIEHLCNQTARRLRSHLSECYSATVHAVCRAGTTEG
jgi:hypothetical protein